MAPLPRKPGTTSRTPIARQDVHGLHMATWLGGPMGASVCVCEAMVPRAHNKRPNWVAQARTQRSAAGRRHKQRTPRPRPAAGAPAPTVSGSTRLVGGVAPSPPSLASLPLSRAWHRTSRCVHTRRCAAHRFRTALTAIHRLRAMLVWARAPAPHAVVMCDRGACVGHQLALCAVLPTHDVALAT